MVPDLFTPSRYLCGIPTILLPLTFARNLMQLAPRAKGLRVFLSGLCSFPVALFVLFGLLFTCARVQFNLHCLQRLAPLSCWVMACCSMSKGLQFTLEALAFSRSRTVVLRFPASLTWQQV